MSSESTQTSDPRAIVFVTLTYAPVIGGAERQAQGLLERWAREGREVWVLTRRVRGAPRHEVLNGVEIHRLWCLWWPIVSWVTLSASVWVFLFPRRRRIKSLWSFMLNAASFAAALAGRCFDRPLVIRISASGTGGNLQVLQKSPGGSALIRFLASSARYLIALNEETVKELAGYGVQPARIKRLSNGVDADVFKPADASQRRLLRGGLELNDLNVATLFVGRFDEQKNVRNLLRVWPDVLAKNPEARLLLAGDGPQARELKKGVAERGLEASVRFLGVRKDILKIYQSCDLFILPSYFEGLPNALLEAMACGLPAIISQVPGNTDVLQDERTGFFVNPRVPLEWVDPWCRLLDDAVLRKRLGDNARQRVRETFSAGKVFQAYQVLEGSLF